LLPVTDLLQQFRQAVKDTPNTVEIIDLFSILTAPLLGIALGVLPDHLKEQIPQLLAAVIQSREMLLRFLRRFAVRGFLILPTLEGTDTHEGVSHSWLESFR